MLAKTVDIKVADSTTLNSTLQIMLEGETPSFEVRFTKRDVQHNISLTRQLCGETNIKKN